ncbi:MAG: hypothetical protein R3B39_00565 [Candidatus Paceibacterota bacterium]
MAIPKKNRISKEYFEEISKNGKGLSSPFLSIKYLKNDQKISLFATVVSKKGFKSISKKEFGKKKNKFCVE